MDHIRKRKAKDSEFTEDAADQSTEVEKKKSLKKAKVKEQDKTVAVATALAASRVGYPNQQVSNFPFIAEHDTRLDHAESHASVGNIGQSSSYSQFSEVVDYEFDHNERRTKKKLKKVKEEDVEASQLDFDNSRQSDKEYKKEEIKKTKKKKKRIKEEKHINNDGEGEEEEEKHLNIAGGEINSKKERKKKIDKKTDKKNGNNEEEHISCETRVSSYEGVSIGDESNKKKKKKRHVDAEEVGNQCEGVYLEEERDNTENTDKKKKKKKKNKHIDAEEEGYQSAVATEIERTNNVDLEEHEHPGITYENGRLKSDQCEGQDLNKKKNRKKKDKTGKNVESSVECEKRQSDQCEGQDLYEKKKKKKKVSFQDQVIDESKNDQEDISTSDDENGEDIDDQSKVEFGEQIWGRRFTREENAKLRRAVYDYIKRRGWDEKEGLQKILNCKKYREAHGCWAEISTCLPHRPRQAIRFRAHMMLEPGSLLGHWSKEEEETLRRLYEKHGRKWKEFADLIGRNRMCIKEKWRSLKRKQSTGVWTQGELQRLSDLVHRCYRVKALLGPQISNDRHLLRDDLNWEKIADDIETHGHGACASKWYYHLTSSMVQEGKWANEDDYLLLKGLLESGACGEEEVDWESVLEHRSGQVSMQRWKQMCKYLGENRTKVFLDKLDILVQRYAPELLEKSTDKPVDATGNDA